MSAPDAAVAYARGVVVRVERDVAGRWRSLCPGRTSPRDLVSLGDEVTQGLDLDAQAAVWEGLARVAGAIAEHFPDNIFADLDAVAGALAFEARMSADRARDVSGALVELHGLYGRTTPIRFRYVHDFLYGFDWARWVAADPDARADEDPFGRAFLGRALSRGQELLALIAARDEKYPPLPEGVSRNPFPFRRDSDAELRLLQALASERLVPLPAWDVDPRGDWRRPFAAIREAKARAMGLEKPAEE